MAGAAETHRGGVPHSLRLAAIALALAVAVMTLVAAPASADTTQTFTSPGCSAVSIPAGDNAVEMVAVGAAGGSTASPGGAGGRASGTIVGVSGPLYVCVNVGAGPAVSCSGCI